MLIKIGGEIGMEKRGCGGKERKRRVWGSIYVFFEVTVKGVI